MGSRFEIPDNFELINVLGTGSYGIVIVAKDLSATGTDGEPNLVAIKKISKVFEHTVFARRTLRELKILRLLNHTNLIQT